MRDHVPMSVRGLVHLCTWKSTSGLFGVIRPPRAVGDKRFVASLALHRARTRGGHRAKTHLANSKQDVADVLEGRSSYKVSAY